MSSRSSLTVRVDHGLCMGIGECTFNAPDSFDVSESGQAVVLDIEHDPEAVRKAAAACPNAAISVAEDQEPVMMRATTPETDSSQPSSSFDALDPADSARGFELLGKLRATCPVSHQTFGGNPVTLVTRYEDVIDVYRGTTKSDETSRYSTALGHSLDPSNPLHPDADLRPVLELPPEDHTMVRKILTAALSPKTIELHTPAIEAIARATVEAIPEEPPVDIKAAWAAPIPSRAIARMLGVPEHDYERFRFWTESKIGRYTAASQGVDLGQDFDTSDKAFERYMADQIQQRHDAPLIEDDLLSRLVHFQTEEGERLTDGQIAVQAIFLLNAGNWTTGNLLVNLVHQMVTIPGLYARVRDDRSLVPSAIEESLRLAPPIQYSVRQATGDTEVNGCPVAAGSVVTVSNLAGNTDPDVFGKHADEFDVNRPRNPRHLSFGGGLHTCLGAALARRVSAISVNALLDRFERLELAPEFTRTREPYWADIGLRRLEVVW